MSFGSHSSWTSGTEKQTDQALRTSELFTVNWMYLLAGEHSMGQAVQYRPGSTTSAGEDIISLGAHRLGSTTSVSEHNIGWGAQHRLGSRTSAGEHNIGQNVTNIVMWRFFSLTSYQCWWFHLVPVKFNLQNFPSFLFGFNFSFFTFQRSSDFSWKFFGLKNLDKKDTTSSLTF